MNRNNYISPRSYGNEATLFINPAKKNLGKSKRKISRPSLILSFLIVFSFFSLILGYSAFADETSDTTWELWDDDEYICIDGLEEFTLPYTPDSYIRIRHQTEV